MTSPAASLLKLFLTDFILANFTITGVIEDPECIYLLEPAYQALLEKGKYPKLDATELNWKIVHAFEHRKIIKRSKPEKDFIRVINNK